MFEKSPIMAVRDLLPPFAPHGRRSARSVPARLGPSDVRTTEIYTKLARAMRVEITSPLDDL